MGGIVKHKLNIASALWEFVIKTTNIAQLNVRMKEHCQVYKLKLQEKSKAKQLTENVKLDLTWRLN